jgi:hypothetical protein
VKSREERKEGKKEERRGYRKEGKRRKGWKERLEEQRGKRVVKEGRA